MTEGFEEMAKQVWAYVPQLVGALLILVAGWLCAMVIAAIVRGVLRRTSLDNRLAQWFLGKERAEAAHVEHAAGKVVFYLLLTVVFIAFFQALGLTLAAEPLNNMLTAVFAFLPRLFGAVVLLVVAWLVASGMRRLVTSGISASKLEARLGEDKVPGGTSLAKSLGEIVYWLVFILFLPAVLGALALQGLLEPVRTMTERLLAYLPNVFAAAAIVVLGWFVARIVRRLATKLLAAIGADRLSERAGLDHTIGGKKLSDSLGLLVEVLILIPVAIAALNALALEALTQPTSHVLGLMIGAVPAILGAALVLLFSYLVGRVVAGVVTSLLASLGFDSLLVRLGMAREQPPEGKRTLSQFVGYAVVVVVMLFATIEAARLLGFSAFAGMVAEVTILGGHVLLGLGIMAIGLWGANLVAETIKGTGKPQANLLSVIARVAILVLAGAMSLRQMGLANEIIVLGFGLIVGAVAVAAAIAFGIGGRDVAKSKLEKWLE
ncbi:MAG: mechanosensitive ion channel [Candidatus Brocadiia bacterium]